MSVAVRTTVLQLSVSGSMDGLRELHSSDDSSGLNNVVKLSQLQLVTETEQIPVVANLLSDVDVAILFTPANSQDSMIRPRHKSYVFFRIIIVSFRFLLSPTR